MKAIVFGILCVTLALNAAENIVQNGSFAKKLDGWSVRGDKKIISVQNGQCLKFSTSEPGWNRCFQMIRLKPSTKYRLAYRMAGKNITGKDPDRSGGTIALNSKSFSIQWGRGLWRAANGTFDWTAKEFVFDSSKFPADQPVTLEILLTRDCTGEFLITDIVIEEIPESRKD